MPWLNFWHHLNSNNKSNNSDNNNNIVLSRFFRLCTFFCYVIFLLLLWSWQTDGRGTNNAKSLPEIGRQVVARTYLEILDQIFGASGWRGCITFKIFFQVCQQLRPSYLWYVVLVFRLKSIVDNDLTTQNCCLLQKWSKSLADTV